VAPRSYSPFFYFVNQRGRGANDGVDSSRPLHGLIGRFLILKHTRNCNYTGSHFVRPNASQIVPSWQQAPAWVAGFPGQPGASSWRRRGWAGW